MERGEDKVVRYFLGRLVTPISVKNTASERGSGEGGQMGAELKCKVQAAAEVGFLLCTIGSEKFFAT